MRKLLLIVMSLMLLLTAAGPSGAQQTPTLRVSGLVKQPLRLSLADLARLPQVRVKYNDITRQGKFRGAFWLRGVPLRDLLELAQLGKEAGGFPKRTDLALVVRTRDGKQVALSWGEVFHRQPSEAILAITSQPVLPKKSCKACHSPDEYRPWLKQLERPVVVPKLVLTRDQYSDRSLEGVCSLEVVGLAPGAWGPKQDKLYSPRVVIAAGGKSRTLDKLPPGPRLAVTADQVGEGKGFHGRRQYSGVPLRDLLASLAPGDPNTVYLVSAPDGYRSLASWGELFLGPAGRRIILADRLDGKPIANTGRFHLVFPDDLWADRWVKAASSIQAVSLARRPRLYVIGMGCGDSSLLTLEALTYLSRADALVAPADIQKRFAPFLAGKPVLFDPLAFGRKPFNPKGAHKDEKARHLRRQEQEKAAAIIRKNLAAGKSVALLDWGDPMLYGSWRWLADFFDQDQITFVPGLSAFNAGSAALARDITCRGAVAISDPFTVLKEPALVASLANKGATLVLFMGLPKFEAVIQVVQRAYPPDTPVAVVYRAGFGQGEKVLRSKLSRVMDLARKQKEGWLGIIFVGPCLR